MLMRRSQLPGESFLLLLALPSLLVTLHDVLNPREQCVGRSAMPVEFSMQLHLGLEVRDSIEHLLEFVKELALPKEIAAFEGTIRLDGLQQFVEAGSVRRGPPDSGKQRIHSSIRGCGGAPPVFCLLLSRKGIKNPCG